MLSTCSGENSGVCICYCLRFPKAENLMQMHNMTPTQVGRDEAKARMKELESELARAEQTSALREEVASSCAQSLLSILETIFYWSKALHSERRSPTGLFVCSIWMARTHVQCSCQKSPLLLYHELLSLINIYNCRSQIG